MSARSGVAAAIAALIAALFAACKSDPRGTFVVIYDAGSDASEAGTAEGGPGFDPAAALVPDPEAIGGWGLLLVSRLASRWGVTRGRPNVAWFEMDLPAAATD